jgi:hypothetical protein
MRRRLIVLVAVLAVGYSLYGGLFLATGAVHEELVDDPAPPARAGGAASNLTIGEYADRSFRFEAVDAGPNYSYLSEDRGQMELVSNAGVYVGDYDSDGWPDVLAVGGEQPVLFENRNGSFVRSGLLPEIEQQVRAAAFVDYNVDGRPDVLLLRDHARPLLLENVGGAFERRSTFEEELSIPQGAAVADFDRDGCPDLFVYQYGNFSARLPVGFHNYSVPVNQDNGDSDFLYRGTCSGFERVPAGESGLRGDRWALAASAVDLNGDGYPDVHQANDINHDVVYLNRGDGSFEQVVLPERTNRNGMSSEVADVTLDGRLDVFVTNIYYPPWAAERINAGAKLKARGNNLITNLDDDSFVMRAEQYGIAVGGFGWAAVVADFDNDGAEDLFHTTRYLTFERRDVLFGDDEIRQLREHPFYSYPSVWRRADATSFDRIDAEASGFLPANGRGVGRLDYDRDGDADLVVATTDQYRLYENRMDRGNAIQVRVLGRNGSGTVAYGANVTVTAGDRRQQRRVHARTDLLSQDSRLVHVGIGNRTRADVRVRWPDGTERRFEAVPADRRLVVSPDGLVRMVELAGAGSE